MNTLPFLDETKTHRFYDLLDDEKIKKLNLYTGTDVIYQLKTDGWIEEGEIWISKWPNQFDPDLTDYEPLKRHEIIIKDANFILVEKQLKCSSIQEFYINKAYLETILKNKQSNFLQLDFNEKERIRVKTLRRI